jgi:hypothetical protein
MESTVLSVVPPPTPHETAQHCARHPGAVLQGVWHAGSESPRRGLLVSRQRPDPLEMAADLGPLFSTAPRLRELAHTSDPSTSIRAAAEVSASGELSRARRLALAWVRRKPGCTAKELGLRAYVFYGFKDPEWWRQRIGRRLNELLDAGLIRREGARDGCACWWPGSNPGGDASA